MSYEKASESFDQRSQNSRHAIRGAFVELVLNERYDEIKVSQIISRSGVARSTFYQHFSSKEDILANSLIPPMSRMAEAIHPNGNRAQIDEILQHFWENRSFCRLILQGTPGQAISRCLSELLEERLLVYVNERNFSFIIEPKLLATQIAEAQLVLLKAWLKGQTKTSSAKLASAISQSSLALVNASKIDQA